MDIISRDIAYELPEGFNVDAYIPKVTVFIAAIAMMAVVVAAILLIVYVRKHQKHYFMVFLGGIVTYVLFYFFVVNTVANAVFLIPGLSEQTNNKVLLVVIPTVLSVIFAVFGRMLMLKVFSGVMKVFSRDMNGVGNQLGFGLGIMFTEGLVAVANIFMMLVSSITIDATGITAILESATSQEEFLSVCDAISEIINYNPFLYLSNSITVIGYMFFHVAISVPLYAFMQKKVGAGYFMMIIGCYGVMELAKYMNNQGLVNSAVVLLITVLAVAVVVVFSLRAYNMHFKQEEDDRKAAEAAAKKKKMPKFDNLSKL